MELYTTLNAHCPAGNCTVDLGELVSGDWDQILFVPRMTLKAVLSDYIDTADLDLGEFDDAVIFAQDRNIIQVQQRTYHPEQAFNESVFLDFPGSRPRMARFSRENAQFSMRISAGQGFRNIYLKSN